MKQRKKKIPVTPKKARRTLPVTKKPKSNGKAGAGGYAGYGGYTQCYDEHPVLRLGSGTLRGGSCIRPKEGYDVYVGLDHGMRMQFARYPWHKKEDTKVEFLFRVTDMNAPDCAIEFGHLIDYLETQLNDGKSVHVGCIGGHGRTGTVFAALVKQMLGVDDAITWVRKQYCKKAVESLDQVEFLHKHYGIKKVEGTKAWGGGTGAIGGTNHKLYGGVKSRGHAKATTKAPAAPPKKSAIVRYVKTKSSVWA